MVGGAGADDSTRGERAVVSMMQACGAERAAGGRRGGRCYCSAASSAEKRGELGGDPPPPPFPLRSGPCGRQLRKEMVAERWRGEVTSTRPPVLPSGADGARGVRRDRDPRTETRTRHCRTGVEPGGVRADPGHVTYGSAETARASPRF